MHRCLLALLIVACAEPSPPEEPLPLAESAPRALALEAGRVALAARHPDEAAELAEQALEADPDRAEAHSLLGRAELARGHAESAREHLSRAIELEPERPGRLFALARATEESGEREAAIAAYQRAAEAGEAAAAARISAARLAIDGLPDQPSDAQCQPIEVDLDAAEEAAGEDEALRAAIIRERRRIAQKREDPRLAAEEAQREVERMLLGALSADSGALGVLSSGHSFGTMAGSGEDIGGLMAHGGGLGMGGRGAPGSGGLGTRGGGLAAVGRGGGGRPSAGPALGGLHVVRGTARLTELTGSERAQRHLRGLTSQIRLCYRMNLRNQDFSGAFRLSVTYDATGSVSRAEVSESTLGQPGTELCVSRAARRARLPEGEAGQASALVTLSL